MSSTYLILTLIGDDRPGLVDSLARTVADHGGNWLESSMSQLAGKFAGILRINVDAAKADALIEELHALEGIRLVVERGRASDVETESGLLHLSLVGNDRPGIVREVFQVLAAQHVNVESLETDCVSAPMSADMLFQASASLRVPPGMDTEPLREALERIADDLIVEIRLNED
ncbi:MAG: ACT domain-containing protein [Pseudohongiellaceae bacterium]